jgi:hypothetical protein
MLNSSFMSRALLDRITFNSEQCGGGSGSQMSWVCSPKGCPRRKSCKTIPTSNRRISGPVSFMRLERGDSTDDEVWNFALAHDLVLVTKDEDFPSRVWISHAHPQCSNSRCRQSNESSQGERAWFKFKRSENQPRGAR